ncbi:MAG TPA: LLM class flavin-dependent oxidoreductase [Chloroflexia bacterium]|nr:LLM class flavin-dependent oxidoreductase [Chloroflexia bacterium]
MSDGGITFGWVISPTPPKRILDTTPDPTEAGRALMEANERFIKAMRPHFDTLWMEDHFQWGTRPTLEAITTLTYLAGRHEGMRFGHIVLGQSYRNAALTAKMAANLQLLTGGNFILGIGAGWKEDEYLAYGYPYPSAGVRIDQLDEAAQIIKALWTESPASFSGKHYQIENAECQPQPNPPIPLLIAGGGEKKTLRVVAKYADWWNYNFCPSEKYAYKQRILEGHCREVGRDMSEIVQTYYGFISIADDPSQIEQRDGIYVVGGTPADVASELQEFVNLGVKHFQLRFLDFPETRGLERFIKEVMPRLKRD